MPDSDKTAEKVKEGISVGRKVLGFLTDVADFIPLPAWARNFLKGGRARHWWQKAPTSSELFSDTLRGPGE